MGFYMSYEQFSPSPTNHSPQKGLYTGLNTSLWSTSKFLSSVRHSIGARMYPWQKIARFIESIKYNNKIYMEECQMVSLDYTITLA